MMKKIVFFLILLFPFLVFSQSPPPLEISYPQFPGIALPSLPALIEQPAPYINYIYRLSLIFGMVLALFSFVFGAFLYIFSAGNISRQMEARDRIFGSLAGVLLLLSSFLILRTVQPEFTKLQLAKLRFPYIEIEKGLWLCPEEIEETYTLNNQTITLTFEIYIQSRRVIKERWASLPIEAQRAIHNLYLRVHALCHLVKRSENIPEKFIRAQHIYILGNYGAIFHRLPNFKGPFTLITLREGWVNTDLFDPNNQAGHEYFHFTLSGDEIPNFSLTLFEDFRLNYFHSFLYQLDPILYSEWAGTREFPATGTIVFYTFRNFHEDLAEEFQLPTSTCPSFRGSGSQDCFKTFEVEIEDFVSVIPAIIIHGPAGSFSYVTTTINLDPFYSLRILPEEGEKPWWIVIVKGYQPDQIPSPDPNIPYWAWALKQPFLWGEAFNKSDRGFEDNYVSYFCEEKARHKRYPCVGEAIIIPGRIIKEIER